MITHIFRGDTSDQSGSTNLTISDVTIGANSMIIIANAYEDGNGNPTIAWGSSGIPLTHRILGGGICLQLNSRPIIIAGGQTRDITISWPGPTYPAYKVAIVLEYSNVDVFGSKKFVDLGSTSNPDTGEGSLPGLNNLALAGFIATKGPDTDDLGSIQNGYSSGDSIGTSNTEATDNVTLHEIYKITTDAAEKPRAYKTNITSRYCLAGALAYRLGSWNKIGLSPGDIMYAYTQFAIKGYDISKHAFIFNQDTGAWELWANISLDGAILVARNTVDNGWIEES